jgi:hypothetical protein
MQALFRLTVAAACAACFSSAFAGPSGFRDCIGTQSNPRIVGLTSDQRLLCFSASRPDSPRTIGLLSGTGGEAIVGIDYRVQNGLLYGVGAAGGVYILDTITATATPVGRLSVALEGTATAIDFNPAADRLRIVTNSGQNLRHDLNTGITAPDDALDYPPGTPPNTSGPTATGISGAAYTNNDLDPNTATTLFVIDANLDQVAIQSPPNNGSLAATGKLGLDANGFVSGFDIYSRLSSGSSASAVSARAFAALQTPTTPTTLYEVNLVTGKTTRLGRFGAADRGLVDIAVPLVQR